MTATDRLKDSPAWFAWHHLGLSLYDWQVEALESISNHGQGVMHGARPTSLRAPNGSGKTQCVITASILWFLWRYPQGWCPVTSGSWMQVKNQLFPALHIYQRHPLFRDWTFNQTEIYTTKGGRAVGFSTDAPGRAEGWHPKINADTDPVYYVLDEAKTIPDGIFDSVGRCTLRFCLLASTPGAPRGKFYRTHHEEAREYRTIHTTSYDCPHIDPDKIERDKRIYGEDDPVFRSMHLAEFTELADRLAMSPIQLQRALDGQPEPFEHGEVVAFCDFAAGRDENVLAVRRGNKARIVEAWREKDTVQGARQFVELFKAEKLKPSQIWGDADGMGTVFLDQLAELGWKINRFHGGTPSTRPLELRNLIAQVWIDGLRLIAQGKINLGELDAETFRQLTSRRTEWTDDGRIRLESKDKMDKSPDRADALLGSIICGARMAGAVTKLDVKHGSMGSNPFSGGIVTGF